MSQNDEVQVSLDIETWGTKPGCVVTHVGAVTFYLDGETMRSQSSFYHSIKPASCTVRGLVIEPGAVQFWLGQKQSWSEVHGNLPEKDLEEVLWRLRDFWQQNSLTGDTPVWCHGPSFDTAIMDAAYGKINIQPPWSYNAARDTRTIFQLAELDFKAEGKNRPGKFHNALDDAMFQAQMVQKAWKKLSGLKEPEFQFTKEQKNAALSWQDVIPADVTKHNK